MPWIVFLPALGALAVYFLRLGRLWAARASAACLLASGFPLLSLGGMALQAKTLTSAIELGLGTGIRFFFILDGLSLVFASLVIFLGLLVTLYAYYYLDEEDDPFRFFSLLLLFAASMLGLVLSDHLVQLVVFWEITSLASFLLIGFWAHLPSSREGAHTALVITSLGGVALLAAAVLIEQMGASPTLSILVTQKSLFENDPRTPWIFGLVLLAAATKSGLFPFHFWLPGAMYAPTPVSAYLHSATLVKAGLFLLMRFFPVLAGSGLWFYGVSTVGLLTLILGAVWAFTKNDLKALLAYSTISHVGLIATLLGFGTPMGLVAGIFHTINHATFKGSLFMAVGMVEHEAGTRDIRRLGGLISFMPDTTRLAAVASLAMAGVPLFNGFLSKEMLYNESLNVARIQIGWAGWWWVLPLLVALGTAFSMAYSIRFVIEGFFGKGPRDLPSMPHEPPLWMRVPAEVLVILCVLVGVFPQPLVGDLLAASAQSVLGEKPEFSLALWHGLTPAALMSAGAIGAGIFLYSRRKALLPILPQGPGLSLYHGVLRVLLRSGIRIAPLRGVVPLRVSLGLLLGGLMLWMALWGDFGVALSWGETPGILTWAGAGFILAGLAGLWRDDLRAAKLLWFGIAGTGVSLLFVDLGALDLALTQAAVEVITLIFLLAALARLPKRARRQKAPWRLALALGAGTVFFFFALSLMTAVHPPDLVRHFAARAGTESLVNAILLDFRGFDTFGETLVLALSALAAISLFLGLPLRQDKPPREPLWVLSEMSPLLFVLILLAGFYLFLVAEIAPGGGFVAGLVAAAGFFLLVNPESTVLPAWPSRLIAAGLGLLLAFGLAGIVLGGAFLENIEVLSFDSSLFFDAAIALAVLGVATVFYRILRLMSRSSWARKKL